MGRDIKIPTIDSRIKDLTSYQKSYEEEWWTKTDMITDIEHTVFHNLKMLGLWSNYLEANQHNIMQNPPMHIPAVPEPLKKNLVANYLIWAVHYANTFGYDIMDVYKWKVLSNIHRAENAMIYAPIGDI